MTTPGALLFADETKQRAYVMAVAGIDPAAADPVRRELRRLLMPGQTSVHFRSESDSRRKQIVDVVAAQGWSAHLVVAPMKNQRQARDACLRHLLALAAHVRSPLLVLETDDSLVAADRRLLYEASARQGMHDGFAYRHLRRREEPCLWVPDMFAWCYARGGTWRARVEPLVTERVDVG